MMAPPDLARAGRFLKSDDLDDLQEALTDDVPPVARRVRTQSGLTVVVRRPEATGQRRSA